MILGKSLVISDKRRKMIKEKRKMLSVKAKEEKAKAEKENQEKEVRKKAKYDELKETIIDHIYSSDDMKIIHEEGNFLLVAKNLKLLIIKNNGKNPFSTNLKNSKESVCVISAIHCGPLLDSSEDFDDEFGVMSLGPTLIEIRNKADIKSNLYDDSNWY